MISVVPEINLRHGHRAQAINGGRVLMRKITTRQRKHLQTMGPVHVDARAALEDLLQVGRVVYDTPLTEVEIADAVIEETAAPDDIEDVILDNEEDSEDEGDDSEANIALIAQIAGDIADF